MLIYFGITPYIVFDGDYLPSKAATEGEREKRRVESRKRGLEFLKMQKPSLAHAELQKAVDVTPEMARQFIEELKRHKVKYVVAPYEADAQLVFLEKKGLVQGIISEDSDLLVFGAKRLLTKLDQHGDCVEINRSDFTACRDISLIGWSDADFRTMAILSGCDYLTNINRMGLKTAYRLVRRHKNIEKILRILQFDGQYHVPSDYLEKFRNADLTFLHQRVYCPIEQKAVMFMPFQGAVPDNFDFIGKDLDDDIATGVARGDLNPMTKLPLKSAGPVVENRPSPWSLLRSKTIGSPAELKPKKSIETFFKPTRVPLAELDPNSFTPSPSQQRLLARHSGVVASSPVDSSPTLATTLRNNNMPASRNGVRQRSSLGNSGAQPAKRQRLCEDPYDLPSLEPKRTERSRFFASNIPDPSPSGRKRTKDKQKAEDFGIFSDASLEEAMSQLPDITDNPKATPAKVQVFSDTEAEKSSTNRPPFLNNESRSSTTASLITETSNLSSRQSQASSVTTATESQFLVDKIDAQVSVTLQALSNKYSYKPSSATLSSEATTPKPEVNRKTIAQGLAGKSHTEPIIPNSPQDDDEIHDPILPTKLILVSPDLPEKIMLQGSEDFLVPNSEDDNSSVIDPESPIKPRLNLSRFSFTPRGK